MFYYTSGVLKDLCLKKSLFRLASSNDDTDDDTRFRLDENKLLIKVEKISQLIQDKRLSFNFHLLLLNDDKERVVGLVREDVFIQLSSKFVEDSVILLNEFSLLNRLRMSIEDDEDQVFVNSFKHLTNVDNNIPILVLENFILIGIDKKQSEPLNDLVIRISEPSLETHTPISKLTSKMNNQNWSIKGCLSKISTIRNFAYKGGQLGKVLRMQFFDRTGLVELVFFNDYCDRYKNKFIVNNCYIIRNSDIKYSKKSFKAWPDDLFSNFDIIVNSATVFEHVPDEQIFMNEIISQPEKDSSTILDESPKVQKVQKVQKSPQNPKSTFITLNQLILQKNKSLVDVIGVICSVGELEYITRFNGKKLEVRRIKIIDQTSQPISVAFWGKQAKDIIEEVKIGDIYMFKGAELSSFAGYSLSVIRSTGFLKITGYYNVSGVEPLSLWWRENKSLYIEQVERNNKRKPNEIQNNNQSNDQVNDQEADSNIIKQSTSAKKPRIE